MMFRRVKVRVKEGERIRYAWVVRERAIVGAECSLPTGDGRYVVYVVIELDTLVVPREVIPYCQDIDP